MSPKLGSNEPWHKRLDDFESFDKITLEVVPRFKTSGLSGNEWRQAVVVKFFFKGEMVFDAHFHRMETAMMMMGAEFIRAQEPIPKRVIDLEESGRCDQPSCEAPSVAKYRLKKEYARGHELVANQHSPGNFRQFCAKHLRRGDSDMEDCDENYEVISGPGPGASTNKEESPARRVEVRVDSLDDLPAAIEEARKKAGER